MRLPKGDRCGTPLRRLLPLAEVGGGVDGVKLCTTLLLSLLPPLVLVHESSDSYRASLSAALFFFLLPPSPPPPPPPPHPPCFFLGRYPPDVPTICREKKIKAPLLVYTSMRRARIDGVDACVRYLASEGAEAEGVEEAALADLAGVGDALAGPRLGALVEEHDARAVDDVRLHAGDVQHLLYLRHPDHVVVRRPPYLLHPRHGQTGNA
uniref:Uncharacterized protein n=1 Tax=Oryza meridionalis TaxID=40149 RepID=A0A0E0CU91_9ORYZ